MRNLLIGMAIAMLSCGAASAAGVAGVRCEDPRVIELIRTSIKDMRTENGQSIARFLGDNSKLTATTISADRNSFICNIHLSVSFGGGSEKLRGRFVYREFSGNRASVKFIPF